MKSTSIRQHYIHQFLYLLLGALIYTQFFLDKVSNPAIIILIILWPLGIRYGWPLLYDVVSDFHTNIHTGRMIKRAINAGHYMGALTGLVEFTFMLLILFTVYWIPGVYAAVKSIFVASVDQ